MSPAWPQMWFVRQENVRDESVRGRFFGVGCTEEQGFVRWGVSAASTVIMFEILSAAVLPLR
jgi:hypothetical protein